MPRRRPRRRPSACGRDSRRRAGEAVVTGLLPHTPGQEHAWAVADLVLAGLDLVPELARVGLLIVLIIVVTPCLDQGDEIPAQVAFDFGRKDDRDDTLAEGVS